MTYAIVRLVVRLVGRDRAVEALARGLHAADRDNGRGVLADWDAGPAEFMRYEYGQRAAQVIAALTGR